MITGSSCDVLMSKLKNKRHITSGIVNCLKYTGASKIMHLKNRAVFVMWDGYIKGNKPLY